MNDEFYEYCPRCQANLTLQKGYSNKLPFWECKGCGEMLINPEVDADDDIAWICDGCGEMLNVQPGFSNNKGQWNCLLCGTANRIDESEVYLSGDEYSIAMNDPYRGMSQQDVLAIAEYEEVEPINGRQNVLLVSDSNDKLFVKKTLKNYDASIYRYIMENPVEYMPKVFAVYESKNHLVVIEEYIEGVTLAEYLEDECFDQETAIYIAIRICLILLNLHDGEHAIVHRDIKPSNIIIDSEGDVYLLDINAAKWYKPDQVEDTVLLGTRDYAAPEQLGYGSEASSPKTDVYALGVLMNVMITGTTPKKQKVDGSLGGIIDRCMNMEAKNRYSIDELLRALAEIGGVYD